MNLLEAKQAYDRGEKITHCTWEKGSYCSNHLDRYYIGLGCTALSGDFFQKWLPKYAEGWEIYDTRLAVQDMKPGDRYKLSNGSQYMRIQDYYQKYPYNSVSLKDGTLTTNHGKYEVENEN